MKADKKQARPIILLCAAVYMISYVTRNSYNAIISEMVTSTGLSKSALSVGLTGAFITYGVGQLVSGYFGDKVQPKTLIAIGLITTSCMNLLIPLCQTPTQMTVVWCLNGFAQSFMWPPIVKILFCALSLEDYSIGCVRVSWGSSIGNILVYVTAPALIFLFGWKSVFVCASATGILGLIFWLKFCPVIDLAPERKPRQTPGGLCGFRIFLPLVLVMAGIIVQGVLKDGITTWMPSYISETFGIRNEVSILAGVALPLFTMVCYSIGNYLYLRLKNPLVCSAIIFTVSTVVCAVLYCLFKTSAVLSVILTAVITGCMHGVNLMLIGIAPTIFAKKGNVSTYSGILNCIAYVGSAFSAYVMPLVTENAGWQSTLLLWLLLSGLGVVLSASCIRLWKRMENK